MKISLQIILDKAHEAYEKTCPHADCSENNHHIETKYACQKENLTFIEEELTIWHENLFGPVSQYFLKFLK